MCIPPYAPEEEGPDGLLPSVEITAELTAFHAQRRPQLRAEAFARLVAQLSRQLEAASFRLAERPERLPRIGPVIR